MDRAWNTTKYPPKPFVILCEVKVNQGREAKKIKFKILGLIGVIHVFRSDFRQKAKNDPRTLFEGPKSEQFENRKNAEVLVNSSKVAFFGY